VVVVTTTTIDGGNCKKRKKENKEKTKRKPKNLRKGFEIINNIELQYKYCFCFLPIVAAHRSIF